MLGHIGKWARAEQGAIAPTAALSLFALIACGGIAFDYARLAALDTELQQAADQAALAAATQLDGGTDSMARAEAAARNLLSNQTRFGNDGGGLSVAVAANVNAVPGGSAPDQPLKFYATRSDAENDTNGWYASSTIATANSAAKFVRVRIAARQARYALTPIVGAFSSGNISAEAAAGLGSSICKVPPLMMCNPQETATNTNFDISGYVGRGMRLVQGGSGSSWAPGNFGYLEAYASGASALEYSLGANNPPGNCLAGDTVTTKPGQNTSVVNAINTRFDIFQSGLVNDCNGGACSPSLNARKDVVHTEITLPATGLNCGFATGNDPWMLPSVQYLPDPTSRKQVGAAPSNMGLPRDVCHAVSQDGDCARGRIGNGTWDRDLYFFVNHGSLYTTAAAGVPDNNWQTISSLAAFATTRGITLSNITRYQVYLWEIDSNNLGSRSAGTYQRVNPQGNPVGQPATLYSYASPQCAIGLGASETQLDRRLTSMAVVNCSAEDVQGQTKNVNVTKWVEVFFVEPSIARPRTSAGDVYVEIVRVTDAGEGSTAGQVIRRDVPYLVK